MAERDFTSWFMFYARPCLSEERLVRGITVKEICKKVPGLKEQTLRLIERQLLHVGPARRQRIADVLQMPVESLFREFSEEEVAQLRKRIENGNW